MSISRTDQCVKHFLPSSWLVPVCVTVIYHCTGHSKSPMCSRRGRLLSSPVLPNKELAFFQFHHGNPSLSEDLSE